MYAGIIFELSWPTGKPNFVFLCSWSLRFFADWIGRKFVIFNTTESITHIVFVTFQTGRLWKCHWNHDQITNKFGHWRNMGWWCHWEINSPTNSYLSLWAWCKYKTKTISQSLRIHSKSKKITPNSSHPFLIYKFLFSVLSSTKSSFLYHYFVNHKFCLNSVICNLASLVTKRMNLGFIVPPN